MSINHVKEKNFSRSISGMAVFFCFFFLSYPALGQGTIDPGDWFILTPDTYWSYTGEGQPNSSAEDDFTNTVLDEKADVGNDIMATRLEMTTTDERDGDQMFWYLDSDGRLLFYGFHNETADDIEGGSFIAQDVILDEPLLIGEKGQYIGDEVTDTGATSIAATVPLLGQQNMDVTLTSTVTYQELIPYIEASSGFFINILRMVIKISVEIQLPFGMGSQTSDLFSGEFWLRKGVGMIYQKQYAEEPGKEKDQIIKEGKIGGSDIQADVDEIRETLPNAIKILQALCGEDSQDALRELDISGDGRAGLAEAIYLLEKISGLKNFTFESSAFSAGTPIPEPYTADGDDISPAISWKNAPVGTKSFVLIMDDPDAVPVAGTVWDHWILYDIPVSTTSLNENAGAEGDGNLPAGVKHGANSWESAYYRGPDPPQGTAHRYFFKLYALNTAELNPAGSAKSDIETAMKGHILGEIEFTGTYIRPLR